jgi:membrane associated rhomboid family serine protease
MVLPLYDDNSDRRITPVVNYVFLGVNIFVFVVLQGLGENDQFTLAFACVPAEIVSGKDIVTSDQVISIPGVRHPVRRPGLEPTPIPVWLTLLTAMFMHGSLAHLFGNMLFLWIFGDNVEDELGHLGYILFYLTTGVLASLAHVAVTYASGADPLVPSLGASGAISGVLGGYLVLHPNKQVTVLLFRIVTEVPAFLAIGIWFLFQVINGLGVLGADSVGGVAYGAHIGGFIAGLVLIKPFAVVLAGGDSSSRRGRPGLG